MNYRDRITPDAAQKAVKPTFNSWRSQLGIKGLESFVYYMIDEVLDVKVLLIQKRGGKLARFIH